MKRLFAFSIVALSCAGAAPPPDATPAVEAAPREPREVTLALESARSARTRARATTPPVYRGTGELEDSLAFMKGELAEWLKDRRAREDAALAAYEKAALESPLAAAYASMEAGELHAEFVDEVVEATLRALPGSIRGDAEQAKSFEASLQEAIAPQASRARSLLAHCLDSANRASLPEIARRCKRRLALFRPKLTTPPPQPEEKLPEAPARKWLDTREVRSCVFAGSLDAYFPIYAKVTGDETVANASGVVPIEVSELEPAATANARMRVDVEWPIRGSWWVAPNAEVLALGQKENIVAKHIWLEAGTEVFVERRVQSSLEVSLDFTKGGRKLEPKSFKRSVSCKNLRLAYDELGRAGNETGDLVLLVDDGAPFFDSPKGKVLGRLAGGPFFSMRRVETKGEFSHVTGRNLFAFDGWVESSRVNPKGLGMIGLLPPKPHSHVVTAEIPLRKEAKGDSPIVAILARDAYITRRRTIDEFVEVAVLGLGTIDAPARFFVEETAFDSSTTAAVK